MQNKPIWGYARALMIDIQTLRPGDWVFLHGDLGSGKTFLVQKICKEMNVPDVVLSPTYSIMNIYSAQVHHIEKILHLDLYRLKKPFDICSLGLEQEFNIKNTLVFIEWPSMLSEEDWEYFFQLTHCQKPLRFHHINVGQNVS